MQIWKKKGLVFDPLQVDTPSWMKHYAAVPFIERLNDDLIRIYFSSRNNDNKSLTGWADFKIDNLFEGPVNISKEPLVNLGRTGMFDEDGVMGCHITKVNGKRNFYYIGWNLGHSTPFRNAIGLAVENEEGGFAKVSEGPIIDRSIYDKCFVASNCVFQDEECYRMYYLSCDEWLNEGGKLTHKYNIKYAESLDGVNWNREGIVAIDFRYENEYAISVPRVIKEDNIYKMWYSYRGGEKSELYRIGYAESIDGKVWDRKDELVEFTGENSDWDSDMICYPYVFDYKGGRFMLYNGNGYGKTGFGIAELEKK